MQVNRARLNGPNAMKGDPRALKVLPAKKNGKEIDSVSDGSTYFPFKLLLVLNVPRRRLFPAQHGKPSSFSCDSDLQQRSNRRAYVAQLIPLQHLCSHMEDSSAISSHKDIPFTLRRRQHRGELFRVAGRNT